MAYHLAEINIALQANGPTAHAFTFRAPFPSPDGVVATDDEWFCPA